MKELISQIRANGITGTVKYVEYNGRKYIVDGHHRYFAAQKLGITQIPVEQISLPYLGYKTEMDLLSVDGRQPGWWGYLK